MTVKLTSTYVEYTNYDSRTIGTPSDNAKRLSQAPTAPIWCPSKIRYKFSSFIDYNLRMPHKGASMKTQNAGANRVYFSPIWLGGPVQDNANATTSLSSDDYDRIRVTAMCIRINTQITGYLHLGLYSNNGWQPHKLMIHAIDYQTTTGTKTIQDETPVRFPYLPSGWYWLAYWSDSDNNVPMYHWTSSTDFMVPNVRASNNASWDSTYPKSNRLGRFISGSQTGGLVDDFLDFSNLSNFTTDYVHNSYYLGPILGVEVA